MDQYSSIQELAIFFRDLKKEREGFSHTQRKSIKSFFSDFAYRKRIFAQYKIQSDRHLSTDFNVFQLLRPDESTLTEVLEFLLDPNGAHGQGILFNRLFIDFLHSRSFPVLSTKYEPYSVKREVAANGRIDLLLRNSTSAIIVENKPFAGDQSDQINRYYNELIKVFPGKVGVVYLSRTYAGPTNFTTSEKREQVFELIRKGSMVVIPYFLLNDFLHTSYFACESNKFRFFISDLIVYIQNTFPIERGEYYDRPE